MLLLPNALSTASKVRSDETAPLTDKDAVAARWFSDMAQRSRSEDQAIQADLAGVNTSLGSIGRILLA